MHSRTFKTSKQDILKRDSHQDTSLLMPKYEDEEKTWKQQERNILLCTREQQKDQQLLSHQKPLRTQASRMAYSNINNKKKQNNPCQLKILYQ